MIKMKTLTMWNLKGNMEMLSFSAGFLMFKFDLEEDTLSALKKGPWFVFGRLLILRTWDLNKTFENFDFSAIPIWVRIYGLPL